MANFVLISSDSALSDFKKYRLSLLDGAKAKTLRTFYEEIEKVLNLPDFEPDMNLLDSLLNDFSWIKQPDVALYITNFDQFLAQEKTDKQVIELLNLLDATAEDWKWLDDEDETPKKNFKIFIQHSPRAVALLEKEEIAFETH